ncbi:MAG TPA: SpoIIE family protein phosphatase [Vicinamibacteria bacterium]|nr:SpoIIE family protein phosphatase [Vicinamibacteria bacterium]
MAFRSVTTRLIFWTVLASGLVFVATLVVSNRIARDAALRAAETEARQATDRLANRIAAVLTAVEESAQLLAETLETLDPDPPATERLLRRFVGSEQDIAGAAAAYAPAPAARGRSSRRALFVFGRSEDPAALGYVDLASREDYTRTPWYAVPAASGEPAWSEPYLQAASGHAIVTYSVPFFAGEGASRRLRGVATADVPLAFLSQIVREVHPGETGRALVLSRTGRILALSGNRRFQSEADFLDQLPAQRRADLEPLVRRMLSGSTGFTEASVGGRAGRILYQPLGRAGWSLGVFYPEQELMAGARQLRTLQAALGVTGLAVLGAVVVALSRRYTAPLRELAAAAHALASNLDAALPETRSQDELGALATAFRDMRDELRRYLRDLEAATKARERLESELAIARRIQMDMLPRPSAGGAGLGYELSALLEPALAVGGDLFDHSASAERVFFLVADVSGKGIPAALFMARASTLVQSAVARRLDPTEILAEVNRGLCRENAEGMYVTAACGVLEIATGELAFACAGHQPPVRLCAGAAPSPLPAQGGTVLGLFEGARFPLERARLAPGEAIFAFTDGVDEAFDAGGALFGQARLLSCLAPLAGAPAASVNAAVRDAVRRFAGEAPQSDDMTMLTLRYLAERPDDD